MKILGGSQVVFYSNKPGNFEVQLDDCLEQLEEYMNEHQIYPGSFIRHNIYVNISDQHNFEQLMPKLKTAAKRRFPLPMLINFIAQPPVEGDLALETTYIEGNAWNCLYKETKQGACQLIKKGHEEVVVGAVQVNKFPDIQQNAEVAFEEIEKLLDMCGVTMGHIVKQWNYLERMLEEDLMTQRYQTFNDVRTKYYDSDFEAGGFPASTEVGMLTGGIIIEFLAVKNRADKSLKIDNPVQKAPYEYSTDVLADEGAYSRSNPTTPKLERARSLEVDGGRMMFISGTSAIIGERLTAGGDVAEQAIVVVENIKKITALENLNNAGFPVNAEGKFSLVKAYVTKADDFEKVIDLLDQYFSDIPVLLVQAALPRKDILFELEAELVFEQ